MDAFLCVWYGDDMECRDGDLVSYVMLDIPAGALMELWDGLLLALKWEEGWDLEMLGVIVALDAFLVVDLVLVAEYMMTSI